MMQEQRLPDPVMVAASVINCLRASAGAIKLQTVLYGFDRPEEFADVTSAML